MFCKNCGKVLGSNDKFCAECGIRVVVEKPKTVELEPMFFVEKREEPVVEKKTKKVVHLDEFAWDLDGFPTEKRKTDAVDFDWASVLEDKVRKASPKPVEERPAPKVKKEEPLGEMPQTVEELLAALPDNVLEIVEEPVEEVVEEPVVKEEPTEEVKSLEQIIEDFGDGPDEPTRLIDKSQMKADSVESFYVFSKKQAEYQNLLDQEYDRIQNSLLEKEEEEPTPTVEEILAEAEVEVEIEVEAEAEVEAEEESVEEAEESTEEPQDDIVEELEQEEAEPVEEQEEEVVAEEPVVEVKELELVAVVWSMPPAGIIVESEPEEIFEEAVEEILVEEVVAEEEEVTEEPQEEAEEEVTEEAPVEEPVKEHLTFADIFNDEEEEEEEVRKGGGCLKFIAVVLMLLVLAELGILGIQHFAKESEAAKMINQVYGQAVELVTDLIDKTEDPAEEATGGSEVATLIAAQQSKNMNIGEIVENPDLIFDAGQDYGYDELATTYAFKNSPWYDAEDGTSVTYGDAIIGVLIQYYSALPDKINDVNVDVLNYVDATSALFGELETMAGDTTRGYSITRLEIGEIKTGQKGFYAMVNVTSADKMQPTESQQKQIVYMEADPVQKVIKIKETKNVGENI